MERKERLVFIKNNGKIKVFPDDEIGSPRVSAEMMANDNSLIIDTLYPFIKARVPKIGKEYVCFDDGKHTPSRMYRVKIKKVIPFENAPQSLIKRWKKQVEEYNWVFAPKTDYFIVSDSYEQAEPDPITGKKGKITTEIFARTLEKKWFGFGYKDTPFNLFNSGELMVREIKHCGDCSLLKKKKDGTYGCKNWDCSFTKESDACDILYYRLKNKTK